MKIKKFASFCLAGILAASALTGCGINKNATAASFADGTTVPMGLVNFTARYQQAVVDEFYRMYMGEDVWTQDAYGATMADSLKDSVLGNLHEMYSLKIHMADYGVSLTDEEKKAVSDAAAAFIAANSSATLKEIGATQDLVEELLTLHTIQSKMRAAIIAGADTDVPDEAANMRAYTVLSFSLSGHYDEEYNYIEPTAAEIIEITQEASGIYAEITTPADLEGVAEAHELSARSATYAADNTTLDEEVKAALDALHEGELSELVTTDSAIYILRLDAETDEEATEANRQSIIEERQDELYDETLSGWQENDGWTVNKKEVAKIQLKNTFTQSEKADDGTSGE